MTSQVIKKRKRGPPIEQSENPHMCCLAFVDLLYGFQAYVFSSKVSRHLPFTLFTFLISPATSISVSPYRMLCRCRIDNLTLQATAYCPWPQRQVQVCQNMMQLNCLSETFCRQKGTFQHLSMQRQDLLKALLEENDNLPKCEQNMPELDQKHDRIIKMMNQICSNYQIWSNLVKRSESLSHKCYIFHHLF
jgi:hypothetical protein